MATFSIRAFQASDWTAVWSLLHQTFDAGDTYAYAPGSSEADIYRAWIESPAATFVACLEDGTLAGTYCLKANQPGPGAHASNCGYVVVAAQQGLGIAAALCEHSQRRALALGFLTMQFNSAVSTNVRAVRLWQRLGFSIVGTLPHAFRHHTLKLVDAVVMHKQLAREAPELLAGDALTPNERPVVARPQQQRDVDRPALRKRLIDRLART